MLLFWSLPYAVGISLVYIMLFVEKTVLIHVLCEEVVSFDQEWVNTSRIMVWITGYHYTNEKLVKQS